MTPHALAQRRRVLFTMLTALSFRYPPGREPAVIASIRQYLGGWPGIGRIVAGMARQQYDLQLTRFGQDRVERDLLPGRDRPLTDTHGGVRLGARAVGGRPAGSVGDAAATGGRVSDQRYDWSSAQPPALDMRAWWSATFLAGVGLAVLSGCGSGAHCSGWGFPLTALGLPPVTCQYSGASSEELARWVGRPVATLERDWGPATREMTSDGLRLLVYEQVEKTSRSSRIVAPGQVEERPAGFLLVRSYLFWIDADGIIVRTKAGEAQ